MGSHIVATNKKRCLQSSSTLYLPCTSPTMSCTSPTMSMSPLMLLLLHSCSCLVPGPWLEGPSQGEVHYYYDRHFDLHPHPFHPPLAGLSVRHGHHVSDTVLGYTSGHHFQDSFLHFSPGFVPVKGLAGYDYSYGRAYGYDLVGPFNQHTGPYGP